MKRESSILLVGVLLFLGITAVLLPSRLQEPAATSFANDSAEYHAGALNIARSGFYSVDGEFPMMGREPGYSLFLGALYTIFGEGNRVAIFLAQAILYLFSVLFFLPEFKKISGERAAVICGFLLLLHPPIFHMAFKVYRESLALSFALIFATFFLRALRTKEWLPIVLSGVSLGVLILTYFSFLLLPVALIPLLLFLRFPLKKGAMMIALPLLILCLWGMRNAAYGRFQFLTPHRTATVWAMRATQAEEQKFVDPASCLYSEYVTRSWPGMPRESCRAEGFRYGSWISPFPQTDEEFRTLDRESKSRIVAHLPMYLFASVFWFIEYHLPYVNGWGILYNVLSILAELIAYAGIAIFFLRVRTCFRKIHLFFMMTALYGAALFSLMYAEPRYRMPTFFCYAALSSLGYASLLERPKNFSSSHGNSNDCC